MSLGSRKLCPGLRLQSTRFPQVKKAHRRKASRSYSHNSLCLQDSWSFCSRQVPTPSTIPSVPREAPSWTLIEVITTFFVEDLLKGLRLKDRPRGLILPNFQKPRILFLRRRKDVRDIILVHLNYNPIHISKMEENQTPERIFNFLRGLGFGFNNQRGMLEHCRDGKNLLKIISQVLKHYEPAYLRSIIAVESHGISSNLEKHRDSLPIIADFLVAKSVFKITNFNLELRDFFTLPQPLSGYQNRRMAILSHLYAVWNWMKEVHTANELGLGRLARLQNDHRRLVDDEAKVEAETEVVNRNKVMERPAYNEKMRLIAEYKEKVAQQRTMKNELAALKVQKDKDLIDKTNELQQILYRTQQLQIEISQARRELSINAPEVRKEKLRQDAILAEALDRKAQQQRDIDNLKDIINKKFSIMENNINKLKSLTALDALEVRSNNLKAQFKKLKRREDQRREAIQRLEAQLAKMESEVQTQENKENKDNEIILQLKLRKSKAQEAVESKKNELGNLTKGISEILAMKRECSTDIEQMERKDLEECNQYEQQMRRLTRQVHEWNKKTFTVLGNAHSSFNMGFFDKSQ